MGPQWINVFNKFKYNEAGDEKILDEVIKKFDYFFKPKKLTKVISQDTRKEFKLRTRLHQRISEMAAQCEFGTLEESQVCI